MSSQLVCYANFSHQNYHLMLNNTILPLPQTPEPSFIPSFASTPSPIDYSVKGNRLRQALDGSIQISPHSPAFIAGKYLKSRFDRVHSLLTRLFSKQTQPTNQPVAKAAIIKPDEKAIKAFTEGLRELFWSISHKTSPEDISKKFFDIIPKDMDLEDVIDHLYLELEDSRLKKVIPIFLEAIQLEKTTFVLSQYNQIRKAIVEDHEHLLTNDAIHSMFHAPIESIPKEQITACYDLAYRINHPFIYTPADTPVPTTDYTLNFLWINLNPQDRIQDLAENIFKEGLNSWENAKSLADPHQLRAWEQSEPTLKDEELDQWKQIKSTLMYKLSKWADLHPHAELNLWYDSALVTQKAQQNTFKIMNEMAKSRGVNLQLRDVRRLSNLQGELENALHPGVPVYFRADLLKAMIADHMIGSENAKYFVFSDVDVEPMKPSHLFDQRSQDFLTHHGYVFHRVGNGKIENSFFIFNKENTNLKDIHYKFILKPISFIISSLREYPRYTDDFRPDYILDSQWVFNKYSGFLKEIKDSFFVGKDGWKKAPRKVVKCPKSQFMGNPLKPDHQAETFRFIGDSNIPYTRFGRNYKQYGWSEAQIDSLKNWKAEPL